MLMIWIRVDKSTLIKSEVCLTQIMCAVYISFIPRLTTLAGYFFQCFCLFLLRHDCLFVPSLHVYFAKLIEKEPVCCLC